MYYSPIVLKSYLPVAYYNHYALLIDGVSILLLEKITPEMIDQCHHSFVQFVVKMEDLYGLSNVSFNVHLCVHLAKSVRDWGPLWTHSAFIFEAYNSKLFDTFKGTQSVPLQICKTFTLNRALPSLSARFGKGGTVEYDDLLKSFLSHTKPVIHALNLDGVTVLGRSAVRILSTQHWIALHSVARVVNKQDAVQYFNRVIVNGEIVHSLNYCQKFKRNSYTAELNDSKLFSIETFIAGDFNGDGVKCYAIGHYFRGAVPNQLTRNQVQNITLRHIVQVDRKLGDLVAILATTIVRKCVFISLPNNPTDYVCRQPNKVEYCA